MKVGVRKLRGTATKSAKGKGKVKAVKVSTTLRAGFKKPTKNSPLPHFRYLNTTVSDVSNDRFPDMVQITAGPTKFKELFGKKYVNETYAKIAIDTIHGECIVDKGKKGVEAELESIGIYHGAETPLPTDGHSLVETLA